MLRTLTPLLSQASTLAGIEATASQIMIEYLYSITSKLVMLSAKIINKNLFTYITEWPTKIRYG